MAQPQNPQASRELRSALLIIILISALIMFAGSVYTVKEVAELYGAGAGALLQANAMGANVISSLLPISSNLGLFHIGSLVSYILAIIAMVLFGSSLVMVARRQDEDASSALTYGLINLIFVVIYALLMVILLSYFYTYLYKIYLYVIYFGIVLGVVANAYLQYELRIKSSSHMMRNSLSIDPSTPYSNIINLQDEIFSKMSGHLRVIDKHFNTAALVNLARLIDGYQTNFNKITVITSTEMKDGKFSTSASEFEKEMAGIGVPTEIRVMDANDALEQHERLLLDDNTAYKIPPFNIINKKSEHITKVKAPEARARFHQLYARAAKI